MLQAGYRVAIETEAEPSSLRGTCTRPTTSRYERLLAEARERFDEADDFTVSVEEEFALLDRESLELVNRFEEVQAAAQDTALEPNLVGELIASEVEVKTGKQASFADVPAALAERRAALDRARRAPRARPRRDRDAPLVELA